MPIWQTSETLSIIVIANTNSGRLPSVCVHVGGKGDETSTMTVIMTMLSHVQPRNHSHKPIGSGQ